jgi:hypothetical protein
MPAIQPVVRAAFQTIARGSPIDRSRWACGSVAVV